MVGKYEMSVKVETYELSCLHLTLHQFMLEALSFTP